MNVRELIAALSALDPDLPVIIDTDELRPEYMEVRQVQVANHLHPDLRQWKDGCRAYTDPSWCCPTDPDRHRPTTPVAYLT